MSESEPKGQASIDSGTNNQTIVSVPVASVGPSKLAFSDILRGSYMWLVALVCLIVAIGVAWWSMPEQGIKIIVHFPDGHGLTVEDSVRFRGIDVGRVEEVKLNRELSGVDVHVNLFSFAEPLAREGTRFWIVRPELSLGGISGLETAVGHKYIGLIPGDPEGEWKSSFQGLAHSPPDAFESNGIEILLRGEKRNSVTAGSPVTYRGVTIGRVLSVELSPDGLKVDARLRILDKHTKLLSSESKFWASGGIDASFSALSGGLTFEMESLETLVQGGVSVLTTAVGGRPIKPGDDFVLHPSAEEQWYSLAAQVEATDVQKRGAIPLTVNWEQKGFLGRQSKKTQSIVGTHFRSGLDDYVLIPSDVLSLNEKGVPGTLQLGITDQPGTTVAITDDMFTESPITRLPLPSPQGFSYPRPINKNELREPGEPESCLVIRANGEFDDLRFLSLAIDSSDIDADWSLNQFNGDRSVWHGAPVLSRTDGKLIGILEVLETESRILVITDALISN